jgi:hypothetical protein
LPVLGPVCEDARLSLVGARPNGDTHGAALHDRGREGSGHRSTAS